MFLADESCDFTVVRALRTAGHDVIAVAEVAAGSDDETVANLALSQQRILLTEDKDFGQLVYAHAQEAIGVILLRFHARTRADIGRTIVDLVTTRGEELTGSFSLVQPGLIRIRWLKP